MMIVKANLRPKDGGNCSQVSATQTTNILMSSLQSWQKRGEKTSNTEQTRNELYLWNRIINERAGDLLRENGMALPQVWNLHHFQSLIPIPICAGTDLVGGLKNKKKNRDHWSQFQLAQVQILWEVSNQCGESLMVPVLGMRGCDFLLFIFQGWEVVRFALCF